MRSLLFEASRPTFRHGVHPPASKERTAGLPVTRMPFVAEYVLPLSQHIGKPSHPIVGARDPVVRGQRIAEADGFISTALHAPVTGTVKGIERRLHPNGKMLDAIVIETDPLSAQRLETLPLDGTARSGADLVEAAQGAGLVGLGGAAFPSHVKLSLPDDKRVDVVIVNGVECEPYLTCDHRLMLERPEAVLRGTELMLEQLGAPRAYIGIEANKPDAIAALRRLAPDHIEVAALEVKYPQGAEKMLIDAVLDREVPSGGLPLDVGIVVNNVGTVAGLADLVDEGSPLVERIVTVTGPGIRHPRNLLVPIGTPVRAVVEHCGGLLPATARLVLGGPMMGAAQKSLDVPVLKGTSGILALDAEESGPRQEFACIRCGRCVDACPLLLNPTRLMQLSRAEKSDELEALNVMDCFECGSCAYACPSNIPLVQWLRMGKAMVKQEKLRRERLQRQQGAA